MPELPEVEAVCRRLRDEGLDERIRGVRIFRCATDAVAALTPGRRIERVERRGKHILVHLSGSVMLHVHLRMSGNFFRIPDHRLFSTYARTILELRGGAGLVLEDPRALARMHAGPSAEIEAAIAGVGVEPLSRLFTQAWLQAEARRSRLPMKLFLMDQSRLAGLGNIYTAEALYRARIDPKRQANVVSAAKLGLLHGTIVEILNDAVQSAVAAYSGPGQFREAESFSLAVYDREGEPCTRCRRIIRRIQQGGRSTYYCPGCQR